MTYKDAGVDVEAGRNLIRDIGPLMESTRREGVLGEVGGFGGLFQVPKKFRAPVLVAGADGVGTKLALAQMAGRHKGVGVDLVAMCANDVLCHGAEPLFFLDYFAAGRLDPEVAREVLEGVAEGCREAGCALLGGETAEMPSFYGERVYELAGFCVGAVEGDRLIDGSAIREGDNLLGLPSSGLHSNGFSLVRKVLFEKEGLSLDDAPGPLVRSLEEELLEPARIYVEPVLSLLSEVSVHGIAHITGGGIPENLGRVLPQGLRA
ncbi:MAG: phosphoribosylformylglycinamidine cyclo-ligase, partial [Nitrospinota bacterium]